MGDTNIAVENAFILCDNNASCSAKCYGGYIFPSGYTEESYRYQNGVWKPIASACKRKRVFLNQYGISFITIHIREFFYSEYHCLNFLDSLIKILYRDLNNLDLNEYICDIQTKKIYISI